MLSLVIAFALLLGAFSPTAPFAAAPQGPSAGPAAKKNAAAAKRLQRQRDHMERQRERLKENRQRFKEHTELVRERLKKEREAAQAASKASGSSADDPDEIEKNGNDTESEGDDDGEGTEVWSGFFPWATDGGVSDNLLTGVGLAALGAAGALILIFGFLGSYLPSMGGKAEYEALLIEIAVLTKRRDQLLKPREKYVRTGADPGPERRQEATNLTRDLTGVIDSKEEDARRKYRQVLGLGVPIYVLIGGVLAVLLATNALQALLIGFAWTSIADRLGLKQEKSEKKSLNDENVDKLEAVANEEKAELTREIEELKKALSESNQAAARMKRRKPRRRKPL